MAKKRANGEGNIRKRKDGRWEGRYTAGIDPETGKPIAKSVLARTQRECKEKLQKAMEELEKIDVTKRRDYTVGEWAQLWYENYAKPSVRASTAAYYKNYIEQHIVPRIGDIKLAALTTLQIQKFYNETKAHGRVQRYENMDDLSLSNKTIRGLHTMLRQCLEQAVTERLIPYNPANGCRLPKKEKKKMQIIPPEKIRDYLKAAEEWGVLPMFYLELSRLAARGAGGTAVERPQFADENADRVQICVARQGRAGRDRTENGKFCPRDLSQRRSDSTAGRRPQESPVQSVYVPVAQDRRDVWPGLRWSDSQEAAGKGGNRRTRPVP